jgi:NAD(P)-dependent dehydrogenase (short-subunit alcohol dehydrogenase family)
VLNGKVVLVTGGAGLLGKEFVRSIVKNGGRAIVADTNEAAGLELVETLLKDKELDASVATFLKLDITSKESICGGLSKVEKTFGQLDAVVNNAYPRNARFGRKFFDVEYADFCENLNLNLGGYFLMSQQASLLFKKQGFGNIVNISSIYGVMAPKFEIYEGTDMTTPVEYAAIKSALIHLTKYMAKYLKGSNIRVNCISPGGVLNRQPPVFLEAYRKQSLNKGMLAPQDLAGTLLFLLSDHSMSINGQNIVVDDGFSL